MSQVCAILLYRVVSKLVTLSFTNMSPRVEKGRGSADTLDLGLYQGLAGPFQSAPDICTVIYTTGYRNNSSLSQREQKRQKKIEKKKETRSLGNSHQSNFCVHVVFIYFSTFI